MKSASCQLDGKRPTRAVEELRQVAATTTERRLYNHQVDCFRVVASLDQKRLGQNTSELAETRFVQQLSPSFPKCVSGF